MGGWGRYIGEVQSCPSGKPVSDVAEKCEVVVDRREEQVRRGLCALLLPVVPGFQRLTRDCEE